MLGRPNALFLQRFDQRRFGVARRWLGEMLLRIVLDMGQLFAGSKRRQLLFLLRLALIVVDDLIAREHIHRVAGPRSHNRLR